MSRVRFSGALATLLLVASGSAGPASAAELPRLVLLLSIDQLRADRVDEGLPGGLGRIAREGLRYTNAWLDHATTETCPGHASMVTGRHPSGSGIPGNRFLDGEGGRPTYCVEDPREDALVFGAEHGRSPRHLRSTSLGDWMKRARPETRVFSVSGKDRAAIMLGGQSADAAYWLNRSDAVGFTTSRYYVDERPAWVTAFNAALTTGLPRTWTHDVASGVPAGRTDDFPGESPEYGRTSGHPLLHGDPERFAENLYATPYLDQVTLRFARELVTRTRLGRGEGPDLLAISLSATDRVGHLYGPYSHESRDTLVRLDRELDRFLDFLNAELGAGSLLVVLTSDHGVLPLPEWLAGQGGLACPEEDGRAGLRMLVLGLFFELHKELGGVFSWPRQWVTIAGSRIGVRRLLSRRAGIPVENVLDVAEAYLERVPAVARAWRADEIRSESGAQARLYRNSFVPGRSGDLLIQLERTCLISPSDTGTGHGSVYAYDRRVPLVFWGQGVKTAERSGRVATVDIAPTLARWLALETPEQLDGRAHSLSEF